MISNGMIFLDVFLGILGLVMALGFIAANDSRRKRYKPMKVKTIAKIITTESEYNMNTNWKRDDTPSMKRLEDRTAKYIFSVNGVEYRGNGEALATIVIIGVIIIVPILLKLLVN